jgi:O-antigen biosynthesis protein
MAELQSIVVPIFQDGRILDLFLDSLWRTIEVPSQVVLLNDGSGKVIDQVIERYRNCAPEKVLVISKTSERTCGAAATLNTGLKLATGRIVILADSDLILNEGWQTALLGALAPPDIGSAGGLLIYPQTGGVQHCGIAFAEDIGRHLFLNSLPEDVPQETFPVQAVVFALCAIPRSLIDLIGPIDEAYFNGYEDLDYQMRIRKLGLKVVLEPRARAHHWERSNGPYRVANRKRNLGRFWRQWGNCIESDLEAHLVRRLISIVGNDAIFRAVDLCRDRTSANRIWAALKPRVPIAAIDDLSYIRQTSEDIWLPQMLGVDAHRTSDRLLFLVDNFVQLVGNRYWLELRSAVRDDDIVIDVYANALPIQRLLTSSWPGARIR